MKKFLGLVLVLILASIVSCAPATKEKKVGKDATEATEEAIRSFDWGFIEEPATENFDLEASLNGERLIVQVDDLWFIETENFDVTVNFDDTLKFTQARKLNSYKQLYSQTKRKLSSVEQILYDPNNRDTFLKRRVFPKGFIISIKNKQEKVIKLIWDENTFITTKGDTSKLVRYDVWLTARNNPPSPSPIPSNDRLDAKIQPIDYITLDTTTKRREFLNVVPVSSPSGESVGLLLTLELEGKKYELNLRFVSKGYTAVVTFSK